MSAATDRSLLLGWGVGLVLCAAGAFVTAKTTAGGRDPGAGGRGPVAPIAASDSARVARATRLATADSVPAAPATAATPAATPAAALETRISDAPTRAEVAFTAAVRTAPAVHPGPQSPIPRPRGSRPYYTIFDSSLVVAIKDSLRRVLDRAVRDSAFPGAYAVVGTSKGIIGDYGAGRIDWAADAPVPTASTIWDLASLTKVVGMTSAVARLVDQGVVRLDAPVQRYLPEFAGPGKERVTVRHLLTHSSGLPSWRPLHKEAETPEARRALVLATPLDTAPGIRYAYSDLGAITLGLLVERMTRQPLDAFLGTRVFQPLGMRDTRYRPDSSLLARIAPTEIDPWRQRHLRGEVHDENAFALGGVSGHAGLFSTGHDLARLARAYLNGGALEGHRLASAATIRRFTRVQDTTLSRRALGWETPTGSNSSGRYMSPRAFGHTGFTGTSIWVDPEQDLFVILLTNRVNPTRQNTRIARVRVALADAMVQTVAAHAGRPVTPVAPPTPPR